MSTACTAPSGSAANSVAGFDTAAAGDAGGHASPSDGAATSGITGSSPAPLAPLPPPALMSTLQRLALPPAGAATYVPYTYTSRRGRGLGAAASGGRGAYGGGAVDGLPVLTRRQHAVLNGDNDARRGGSGSDDGGGGGGDGRGGGAPDSGEPSPVAGRYRGGSAGRGRGRGRWRGRWRGRGGSTGTGGDSSVAGVSAVDSDDEPYGAAAAASPAPSTLSSPVNTSGVASGASSVPAARAEAASGGSGRTSIIGASSVSAAGGTGRRGNDAAVAAALAAAQSAAAADAAAAAPDDDNEAGAAAAAGSSAGGGGDSSGTVGAAGPAASAPAAAAGRKRSRRRSADKPPGRYDDSKMHVNYEIDWYLDREDIAIDAKAVVDVGRARGRVDNGDGDPDAGGDDGAGSSSGGGGGASSSAAAVSSSAPPPKKAKHTAPSSHAAVRTRPWPHVVRSSFGAAYTKAETDDALFYAVANPPSVAALAATLASVEEGPRKNLSMMLMSAIPLRPRTVSVASSRLWATLNDLKDVGASRRYAEYYLRQYVHRAVAEGWSLERLAAEFAACDAKHHPGTF